MVMPDDGQGSRLDAFYAAEAAYLAGGMDDAAAREAFRNCFTPDVVVREPESLPYGGEWRGREGVERLMRRLREVFDEADFSDRRTFECGDTVFMAMRSRIRSRATGRTMMNSVLHRIELRDGLIATMEIFHWDPAAIRGLCDPDRDS
ncbi:nuclear transport factor 2 family protein [Actinomadura madurae]|uniref:nuclear transport factor 2 family protein n=2 Tax=Actinomadura madurae TaxID=1993 RepID=UPI0020D24ACC|nr:nuclear transport factor 2 family protein [Actinomadura madurae]MCQ0007336.1 nuclear transport factor 2 family protein [Actinomadura madurae]MCQ0017362.1 nuclear transport factor 2 family protein [Actinomadura madurae]